MPIASFKFGAAPEHQVRVEAGWIGRTRYFVDGRLIATYWALNRSTQSFDIDGSIVRVETRLSGDKTKVESKAFVDGQLVADDLFNEYNAQLQSLRERFPSRRRMSFSQWLIRVCAWAAGTLLILEVYHVWHTGAA
jgi:hypothetical protein